MINFGKDVEIVWKDRKRICGLPISFTQYAIIRKPNKWTKLIIQEGMMQTKIEEIHCYRIDDISLFQNAFGLLYGVGNITVYCNDSSCKSVILKNVKNPEKVRMLINDIVEEERAKKHIQYHEAPNN